MDNIAPDLRQVMRRMPTGVCIVTTEAFGEQWGMTANSLVSISLEPPVISITAETAGRMYPALSKAKGFTVSILVFGQASVARVFADPLVSHAERFASTVVAAGAFGPRIAGASGYLECKVLSRQVIGDHELLCATVETCDLGTPARPLVFYKREYHSVSEINSD